MMQDFTAFLAAMRGRRLLHLGHKDADCDALGSAYALSRVLPGDIGCAQGLKLSAGDLAKWLGVTPVIDPDPAAYDYTIIYDGLSPALIGLPLPLHYALFDHHMPGGSRGNFPNLLAQGADWCWVRPVESTCSVLAELLLAHAVPIDRRMGVALAAGLMTDTDWLRLADASALHRLAAILETTHLCIGDVLEAVDNAERHAARRSAVLAALRTAEETQCAGLSILAAETDCHDHGFAVASALGRLGADVRAVAFPRAGMSMVMLECDDAMAERTGLDLLKLVEELAQRVDAAERWGSPAFGRIVAPLPARALLDLCVEAVLEALRAHG